MNTRKFVLGAIGVGAFIVGGIVARTKALETVEIVENFFQSSSSDTAAE